MPRFVQVLPIDNSYKSYVTILDIGPEDAQEILHVMDLMAAINVEYSSGKLRLYDFFAPELVISSSLENDLQDEGDPYQWNDATEIEWSEDSLPYLEDPEANAARVDYITTMVGPNEIHWTVHPRYAPDEGETDYIHRETLEAIAGTVWPTSLMPLLHAWSILRNACGAKRLLYLHDFVPDNSGRLVASAELSCGSDAEWEYAINQLHAALQQMPEVTIDSGATTAVLEIPETAVLSINRGSN